MVDLRNGMHLSFSTEILLVNDVDGGGDGGGTG